MSIKFIADNRKAKFDYEVKETFEAGIVLNGDEVKSLRDGGMNLKDSFCVVLGGELFLRNCYIKPYDKSGAFVSEARRDRKLLMHRTEIVKLASKIKEKGLAVIPLNAYFKGSFVKLEIALCQGKKLHDKRETLKRRIQERDAERAMKEI